MKILRIVVLTATMALLGTSAVISQSPPPTQSPPSAEALQAARELASLSSLSLTSQLVTNVTDQIWPNMEQSLRARNPRIDAATLLELRHEYERLQLAYASRVANEAPAMYVQFFTAAELREILTFYRTPTGTKMLRLMPQINGGAMAMLMSDLPEFEASISQGFDGILRQRGYVR
jgi:hypothetical protein